MALVVPTGCWDQSSQGCKVGEKWYDVKGPIVTDRDAVESLCL